MAKSQTEAPGTMVVIGQHRIYVDRKSFLAWEKDIMTTAGFTNSEIKAEILRRLGICTK